MSRRWSLVDLVLVLDALEFERLVDTLEELDDVDVPDVARVTVFFQACRLLAALWRLSEAAPRLVVVVGAVLALTHAPPQS